MLDESDRKPAAQELEDTGKRPQAPPVTERPSPEATGADTRGVVLVVEDDPAVLVATVDLVEALGYRVLQALDGEEALSVLDRAEAVDVLMTDLRLGPGKSGRDLARQAVSRRPDLKVLYASGDTRQPPEGAAAILKPYTMKELERRLQSLLADAPAPPNDETGEL